MNGSYFTVTANPDGSFRGSMTTAMPPSCVSFEGWDLIAALARVDRAVRDSLTAWRPAPPPKPRLGPPAWDALPPMERCGTCRAWHTSLYDCTTGEHAMVAKP